MVFLLTTPHITEVCRKEVEKNVDVLRSSLGVLSGVSARLVVTVSGKLLAMMVENTIWRRNRDSLAVDVEERVVLDDSLECIDEVLGMNDHARIVGLGLRGGDIVLWRVIVMTLIVIGMKRGRNG